MKGGYRRRNAMALHGMHYGPNMTPMVDVVLVILIFFMASASVMGAEWLLNTALPTRRAGGSAGREGAALRLELAAVNGEARVGASVKGRVARPGGAEVETLGAMDLAGAVALVSSVAREVGPPSLTVTIVPSGAASWEWVVRLHEACHAAGVTRVGVAGAEDRAGAGG